MYSNSNTYLQKLEMNQNETRSTGDIIKVT